MTRAQGNTPSASLKRPALREPRRWPPAAIEAGRGGAGSRVRAPAAQPEPPWRPRSFPDLGSACPRSRRRFITLPSEFSLLAPFPLPPGSGVRRASGCLTSRSSPIFPRLFRCVFSFLLRPSVLPLGTESLRPCPPRPPGHDLGFPESPFILTPQGGWGCVFSACVQPGGLRDCGAWPSLVDAKPLRRTSAHAHSASSD